MIKHFFTCVISLNCNLIKIQTIYILFNYLSMMRLTQKLCSILCIKIVYAKNDTLNLSQYYLINVEHKKMILLNFYLFFFRQIKFEFALRNKKKKKRERIGDRKKQNRIS